MYRSTRFGELLEAFPRGAFARLVDKHESDKHCKGFNPWSHMVAMLYAQLTGSKSLRELETGFNAEARHHYHLGMDELKRSTISDANSQRDSHVFEEMCTLMLSGAHRKVRQQMKQNLYLIDSSPVPLKGLGYEWTKGKCSSRVEGLSVHMIIEPNGQVPVGSKITYSNVTDVQVGKEIIEPEEGATYVFDKGYCDYTWWFKLHEAGSLFVTRLKNNAAIEVVKERVIRDADRGFILEDTTIKFTYERSGGNRPKNAYFGKTLRRIVVDRGYDKEPIVLVTNDKKRRAHQIAALYKQRWDIELFFKWLKQNLKIKKFLGRSENAVKIQIYCAIIVYLLASEYRLKLAKYTRLKDVLTLFRTGLFSSPKLNESDYRRRKEEREKLRKIQPELDF